MRVFEPIQIGNVIIPNRIFRAAHGTFLARGGITDAFIDYHLAAAKGGCGLTVLETASVHPSAMQTLPNYDASIIPGYQRLMKAIRPQGMRVFQQLHHGGHNNFGATGAIPVSASTIASPGIGVVPVPLTVGEIAQIVAAFAAAAVRCREGGLDGVEVHAAHGYLLHQFLSPLINRRTDRYGGSIENRMRLTIEVVRAVRNAVGPDFAVGVRLSASQALGGTTEADQQAVVIALESEGLIDFVSASYGDYYRMDGMNSAMQAPTGYQLPSSGQIAAVSKVPRMVAGRFRTLEEAEQVLREGAADLVALVRAHIADPDIVRKTREGRTDEIRPCISCNQGCIGGLFRVQTLGCAVNPAIGFQSLAEDLIRKTDLPKRVLVIGGGPAGMEAARSAAIAGHTVTLAEAQPDLGGMINVARRGPRLHTLGDISAWFGREVYRLGVEVKLNSYMTAAEIRRFGADAVVIATGSLPRMDGVQIANPGEPALGHDLPHVVSSIDLLMNPQRDYGKAAIVVDDVGHFEGIAAAEFLVERGVAVILVTRHASFAPLVDFTLRTVPALERLYQGEFNLLVRHHLSEIRNGECSVRPLQSARLRTLPADTVVLVTANAPLRELYDELRDEFEGSIQLIGDARSPRDLQAATAEGRRAALALTEVF